MNTFLAGNKELERAPLSLFLSIYSSSYLSVNLSSVALVSNMTAYSTCQIPLKIAIAKQPDSGRNVQHGVTQMFL